MTGFEERFNACASLFNEYAQTEFERLTGSGTQSPGAGVMAQAMRYSLFNAGKRIRPVLCLEFCRACGADYHDALPFALAAEMVHTYSLIHDDLPCMDNDDMRRGMPSSHIAFGEANALLAGDALLTLAFEEIAGSGLDGEKKSEAALLLAKAAGFRGMIAGQVMDLKNENIKAGIDDVRLTDMLKTGEMIKASALLGCVAAGEKEKRSAAEEYCGCIGLAFQIVDDILDVTGDSALLGKNTGSDEAGGKSTYVSLLGVERCAELAGELTRRAVSALGVFGEDAEFLKWLAEYLCKRKN